MPSFAAMPVRRSLAGTAASNRNVCGSGDNALCRSGRRRRCAKAHQAAGRNDPDKRRLPHSRTVSAAGFLNTTKCDSEKFTMKLTPVASTFPNSTGMKWDATRMVVVFAAKPAS